MKGSVIIDWNRVFSRIPEIMGLELRLKGNAWEGRYYLNGDRHAYKDDKLKVKMYGGNIYCYEQGGDSVSLKEWLFKYGGCKSWADVYKVLEGTSKIERDFSCDIPKQEEVKYIPQDVMEAMEQYPLDGCPLFRWMSGFFGIKRTESVWKRYHSMRDGYGNAVFWYVNKDGKILHDKKMAYFDNGHRSKRYGGGRQYRVRDGYSGRCLFGEHLIGNSDVVSVVESEKSALLASCAWGDSKGVWVATGGKGNLGGLLSVLDGKEVRLFPDRDAVEEWTKYGKCVEWWKGRESKLDDHADVGDLVVSIWKR